MAYFEESTADGGRGSEESGMKFWEAASEDFCPALLSVAVRNTTTRSNSGRLGFIWRMRPDQSPRGRNHGGVLLSDVSQRYLPRSDAALGGLHPPTIKRYSTDFPTGPSEGGSSSDFATGPSEGGSSSADTPSSQMTSSLGQVDRRQQQQQKPKNQNQTRTKQYFSLCPAF